MARLLECADTTRRYLEVKRALSGVDAEGRKIHPGIGDDGVISLAQGNGVRRPHPAAIAAGVAALLDPDRSVETYASHARDSRFDAAIERTFRRFGIPPAIAGSICVDSGLTRLLAGFFFAVGRPGDAFLVNRAFYHGFASLAEACQVRLVPLETDAAHGYKVRAEDLHAHFARSGADGAGRGRVRGLILVQPSFTGELYRVAELRRLADAVTALDLTVFADMTFACTEHDLNFFRPALASVPGMQGRVVSAMSASKAFGLANLRIGWACGPSEIIRSMNFYATATGLSVPQVAKSMATAALEAPVAYLEQNAREADRRKRLLVALIAEANRGIAQRWAGPKPAPAISVERVPNAGHCMLVSMEAFRGLLTPTGEVIRNSLDITRYLLRTAKVAVSPCHSGGIDHCLVRLAFGDLGAAATYGSSAAGERRRIEQLLRDGCPRAMGSYLWYDRFPEPKMWKTAGLIEGRRILRVALAERVGPALAALRAVTPVADPQDAGSADAGRDGLRPGGVGRQGAPPLSRAVGYAHDRSSRTTVIRAA